MLILSRSWSSYIYCRASSWSSVGLALELGLLQIYSRDWSSVSRSWSWSNVDLAPWCRSWCLWSRSWCLWSRSWCWSWWGSCLYRVLSPLSVGSVSVLLCTHYVFQVGPQSVNSDFKRFLFLCSRPPDSLLYLRYLTANR